MGSTSSAGVVSPRSSRKRSRLITKLLELSFLVAALMFALRAYSRIVTPYPELDHDVPPNSSQQIQKIAAQKSVNTIRATNQQDRTNIRTKEGQQIVANKLVRQEKETADSKVGRNGVPQNGKNAMNAASFNGNKMPKNTPSNLKLAWLMSFPNSGTSYTLDMVRESSRTAAATNYGIEIDTWDADGNSIPVYDNQYNGPYWLAPEEVELPTKLVLTKTHCGGHCSACKHFRNQLSLHSFSLRCRSGMVRRMDLENLEFVSYSDEIVRKAIHLFRNPMDNIVARFHHYIKNFDIDKKYPNTKEGFRSYCFKFDEMLRSDPQITQYVDRTVMDMLENVPCHFDLLRYSSWHDMAFLTTDELALPTYILHYEKYSTQFNQTEAEILNFLELEKRGEPPVFIKGKEYADYFSDEEWDSAKMALEAVSSKRTWEHIRHYFDANMEAPASLY